MKKIILSIVAMMTVVCGMAQSNDKSEHRQPNDCRPDNRKDGYRLGTQ
jgi:Ni/Co efflux regulator RcnB